MSKQKKNKKLQSTILSIIILILIGTITYFNSDIYSVQNIVENSISDVKNNFSIFNNNTSIELQGQSAIPKYAGKSYVEINNNLPYFTENNYSTNAFEIYSELDELRQMWCCICKYLCRHNA